MVLSQSILPFALNTEHLSLLSQNEGCLAVRKTQFHKAESLWPDRKHLAPRSCTTSLSQ